MNSPQTMLQPNQQDSGFHPAVQSGQAFAQEDSLLNEFRSVRKIEHGPANDHSYGAAVVANFNVRRGQSNYPVGRVTGPVNVFFKIMQDWNIDLAGSAAILGFETAEQDHVNQLRLGFSSLRGRDKKDRLFYAISIHHGLRSLFRSVDAERTWLNKAMPELQGQTPISYLLDGAMVKLLAVKQLVDLATGK